MKKIILLLFTVSPFLIHAQYFHKHYGTASGEDLRSGVVTHRIAQGHFMVGMKTPTGVGQQGFIATYTDLTGTPVFNKTFNLQTSTGVALTVNDAQGVEFINAIGFGIVGTYSSNVLGTPVNGVFYMILDGVGNVVVLKSYFPQNAAFSIGKIGGINKSLQSAGRELYVTGTAATQSQTYAFALNIGTNSGNLFWGKIYDLQAPVAATSESGDDIIENIFKATSTSREVMMIGNTNVINSSGATDTYATRIDALTGLPVPGTSGNSTVVHTASGDARFFNGITLAQSSAGGKKGFMIAGSWYSAATGHEFCLTKLDDEGNLVFQKVSPYNNYYTVQPTHDALNNVIELQNAMFQFEYYAVGHTSNGNIGGYDIVVLKTDDFGVTIPNAQFTYGTTGNEYGFDIDMERGSAAALNIFGTKGGGMGAGDMYHIRSYFNGASGCDERMDSSGTYNAAPTDNGYLSFIVNTFKNGTLLYSTGTANAATICFNNTLPGGSNARLAPNQPKGDNTILFSPNPMAQGTANAIVQATLSQPATATITIYDMLGRQYYSQTANLREGINNLPVDFGSAMLPKGVYMLTISAEGINHNSILLVE